MLMLYSATSIPHTTIPHRVKIFLENEFGGFFGKFINHQLISFQLLLDVGL